MWHYPGGAEALSSIRSTLCLFFEAFTIVAVFSCLTEGNGQDRIVNKRENTEVPNLPFAVAQRSESFAYSTKTPTNSVVLDLYNTNKAQCNPGWTRKGERCFRLTSPKTWNEILKECRTSNGLLAEIRNKFEQDDLRDFLDSQVKRVERAWIGLSDQNTKRRLQWISGKNITYNNWYPGQAVMGKDGENCVSVLTEHQWNINNCLTTVSGVCQKGPCDPGWTLKGGFCYMLTREVPRLHAQEICRSMHGSLAEIFNVEEQNSLDEFLKASGVWRVWIGLSEQQKNNIWVWDSGRNVTYTNWVRGEPSSMYCEEDCVEVWPAEAVSKWNDEKCNETRIGVCQKLESPCKPGWLRRGGFCYTLTRGAQRHEAQHRCRSMNSSLAEIYNVEDQSFLHDFLKATVVGSARVWIGLSDQQREGQWMWDSGRNATYTNWIPGEPNSGRDRCVDAWPAETFSQWNDENCNRTRIGVCHKRACGQSGWTLMGDFCYRLTPPAFHVKAQDICRSWDASLAEIFTSTQQVAIQDFLKTQEEPIAPRAWIGLADELKKGVWSWASGQPLMQSVFWINNYPSNPFGDTHCGNVLSECSWDWNHAPCSSKYSGVCVQYLDCADSSQDICWSLSRRGLCSNSLFRDYMEVACPLSCGKCR